MICPCQKISGCRCYTGVPNIGLLFNDMQFPHRPKVHPPLCIFSVIAPALKPSEVHGFLTPCSSFLTLLLWPPVQSPQQSDQTRHSQPCLQQSQGHWSCYWEKRVSRLPSPWQSQPGLSPRSAQAQRSLSLCRLWDSSWLLGLLE